MVHYLLKAQRITLTCVALFSLCGCIGKDLDKQVLAMDGKSSERAEPGLDNDLLHLHDTSEPLEQVGPRPDNDLLDLHDTSESPPERPATDSKGQGSPEDEIKKILGQHSCPITQEEMKDPVVAADGHSYERTDITKWLQNNRTSPMTNEGLADTSLRANHALRSMTEALSKWLVTQKQKDHTSLIQHALQSLKSHAQTLLKKQSARSTPPLTKRKRKSRRKNEGKTEEANALHEKGIKHCNQRRYNEAVKCHERALKLRQEAYTKPHPDVAKSHICLGDVYEKQGKYFEALEAYNKAIEVLLSVEHREQSAKQPKESKISSRHNTPPQGGLRRRHARRPEAKQAQHEAADEAAKVSAGYWQYCQSACSSLYHRITPSVAAASAMLGVVGYYGYHTYKFYQDGPDNIDVLGETNAIANATIAQIICPAMRVISCANYDISKYINVAGFLLSQYAPNNTQLAENVELLCSTHQDIEELAPGQESFTEDQRQALEQAARLNTEMGCIYIKQDNYPAALAAHQKSLQVSRTLYSVHPDLANSYNNIGEVYYFQNRGTKALEAFEKALQIHSVVYGEKPHPDIATIYSNIGAVYRSQKRHAEALAAYNKALKMYLAVYRERPHSDVANTYNNVGDSYLSNKEYEEALVAFKKALEMRQNIYRKYHPDIATSYNNMGIAYHSQGQYEKALAAFDKALEMRRNIYGERHPDTKASYLLASHTQRTLEAREETPQM